MENLEEKIKEKVEELKESNLPFQILENISEEDLIYGLQKSYLEKNWENSSIFNKFIYFFFVISVLVLAFNIYIASLSFILCIGLIFFKYLGTFLGAISKGFNQMYLFHIGGNIILFSNGIILGDRIISFGEKQSDLKIKRFFWKYEKSFLKNAFYENEISKKDFDIFINKKSRRNNFYRLIVNLIHFRLGLKGFIFSLVFWGIFAFSCMTFPIWIIEMNNNGIGEKSIFVFYVLGLLSLFLMDYFFIDLKKIFYKPNIYISNKIISTYLSYFGNNIYQIKRKIINLNNSLNLVISSGEEFRQTIKTFYNGNISNISSDLSKNIQILHKNISLAIISKSKLEKEIGNDEKLNEIIDLPKIKEFLKFQFNNPINLLIVFLVKYGKENEKMLLEVQKLNLKDKEIILENNIKTIKETLEKLKSLNI